MTNEELALLPRLTDYLTGECSPDDRAAVERAIATSPTASALFHDLRAGLAQVPDLREQGRTELSIARPWFAAPPHVETVSRPSRGQAARTQRGTPFAVSSGVGRATIGGWRRRIWAGVGSAIALILCVFAVRPWMSTLHASRTSRSTEYATTVGQQAVIDLPDGTRAILAPASRLQYRADMRAGRVLSLEGEAFFDVAHDAARTFTVIAGGISTRVLGTSFSVRHYASDRAVQVAVVTGKVSTQSQGRALILTPGALAYVTDSGATFTKAGVSAATAWVDGSLIFDNAPVSVVLKALSRWYGYEFTCADSSIAAQRVSTVFQTKNSANTTISLLEDLLDVTVTVHGRVATLHVAPVRKSQRPSAPPIVRTHDAFAPSSEVGK